MTRNPLPATLAQRLSPHGPWTGVALVHATAMLAVSIQITNALAVLPEPSALIDQQYWMFCHTPGAPFPAPSFHQIAQRYRDNQEENVRMLAEKLRRGGNAHWGDRVIPLSAERGTPLSASDARTLARWVLSQ